MSRNFEEWFSRFRPSLADYKYYVDFDKVISNVNSIKYELNILNSLIGSNDIESEFEVTLTRYPETLKCIPILLAKRESEILIQDEARTMAYHFDKANYSADDYKVFMRQTGLFYMLEKNMISNLLDYVTGVEVGLDSNARKNRGGSLMEKLIARHLEAAGFKEGVDYFKQMTSEQIHTKWNIDLSCISNDGKVKKKFDFVVKSANHIYAVEANFYQSQGSKLNETARSYKHIAEESRKIDNFTFVWFTDGAGWVGAKRNLEEVFGTMTELYNIEEIESGVMKCIFV